MRRSIAAVALVAAASLAVVGIAPASQAAVPTADGVAIAKAVVAKYSKNPTSLGNIPVIGKPIPKGKYVITITNATDSAVTLNHNIVAAGKLLGWKMDAIQAESTIEGQRKALQQAISKKPNGIAVSGMETDTYGDLYKLAASKGIAIVCSACMSRPGSGLLDSHISGPNMLDEWGKMIAAFTVANVKGTPNVQMFGYSVYPILQRFDKAYAAYIKKLSPAVNLKYNELDLSNVPQQVANTYRANPGTNMVTSDLGDFFIGVPQGLFNVGATPGQAPLVGGLTAGKDAIQTLKNKTTNAWTGYSLPIVGYSVIDSFARYWTNTPFATANLPTQILTQKNINGAVIDTAGNYVGVKDFESQFKKIWGLK